MIDEQMKKYFLYITISLCGLLVTACQQETLVDSAKGGFAITLLDETAATDVMTKASPLKLPASVSKEFHLTITKNSNGYVLYDGGYTEEVIPAAAFGEENILEVNNPYFVGEEDNVEVKAGDEPTTVELACKLANALTSVRFGEGDENRAKFDELYAPGYGVKIAIGHYSTVLTDSMKVAYYKAGTKPADVTLAFVGTIRGNGQAVEYPLDTKQFPQLAEEASYAAGAHIRLVLDMAEMATGLVPTIVYAEVVKETVTETFPMEWLPKPQVEARGDFDAENKILFYETEQPTGSIKFNSALGLQDLKFTVAFNDPTYSSLNGDYTLSTMTDTEKQAFATAGIILPVLGDGAENDSIGFTKEFITALTYSVDKANDKKEVSNVIQLTEVKANDKSLTSADVAEGELEFEVAVKMKPAFTVSVQDYNIWSKTFTIDEPTVTSDDPSIVEGMTYWYSLDDGKTWESCDRTKALDSHPDVNDRDVRVKATFRGFESKAKRFELEEPLQIPNSDMEDWHTVKVGSITLSGDFYRFYPYAKDETDKWWDTNSSRSQDYPDGAPVKVTTCPCVSYSTTTKYSGSKSAFLYTSLHGGGYANTAGFSGISGGREGDVTAITYPEGAFAGSLLIGSYSWSQSEGETGTVKGHTFPSRPTHLSFYYNYTPYTSSKSDTFKAYIELRNGEEVIATGESTVTASANTGWKNSGKVELNYNVTNKVATSIYVQFLTTTKTSFSKDDFVINKHITLPVMGDWYTHIGSMLYIDDISLIYDK